MKKQRLITAGIHQILSGAYIASQTSTLTACVLGLIAGGEISITGLGRHLPGYTDPKHKIKRVDRFCGNDAIALGPLCKQMLLALGSDKGSLLVSVDWTKIGKFQTLTFAVSTLHGRSIPVYWEVIDPDVERMKAVELAAVKRFHSFVPRGVKVILLADRGFDDVKFLEAVARCFEFVIRLSKDNTISKAGSAEFERLSELLTSRDEVVDYGSILFTKAHRFRTRIVGLHTRKSVDPLFVATSLQADAEEIVRLYARRFDIEHAFKDWKDVHHGWQLGSIRSTSPERLARLLIIPAVAFLVLVLLGLLAESRNLHWRLQVNSVKNKRCLSLWRVGRLVLTTMRRLRVPSVGVLLEFLGVLTLRPEVG